MSDIVRSLLVFARLLGDWAHWILVSGALYLLVIIQADGLYRLRSYPTCIVYCSNECFYCDNNLNM